MAVNQTTIDAFYLIVKQASDEVVLQVVDMTGRLGKLAAAEMQAHDFDYWGRAYPLTGGPRIFIEIA